MIAVAWGDATPTVSGSPAREFCPLKRIVIECAEKHGVTYMAMLGKRRGRPVAWARQEAYWRCYNETGASFPEIGRAIGHRDHTTIITGKRRHEERMKAGK